MKEARSLQAVGRGLAPLLAIGMLGAAVLHAQACGSSQSTESPAVQPETREPNAPAATASQPAQAPASNVSAASAGRPEEPEAPPPSTPDRRTIEPALLPATKFGGFLHLEPRPVPQAPTSPTQSSGGTTP